MPRKQTRKPAKGRSKVGKGPRLSGVLEPIPEGAEEQRRAGAVKKISEGLRPPIPELLTPVGCFECGSSLVARLSRREGDALVFEAACPVDGFVTTKAVQIPAAGV